MKLLPLLLLPILLCSCVIYSYRFTPTESGERLVQHYGDSLLECTIEPIIRPPEHAPYARIEIVRGAARTILVTRIEADMIWDEGRAARWGVLSYYVEPITDSHVGPYSADSIETLDLPFRSLQESMGTRELLLEYHFARLPHGLDKATVHIDLHLLVDGRPVRITRTVPLLIDTKAHWNVKRH